jgi:hypothetical protein
LRTNCERTNEGDKIITYPILRNELQQEHTIENKPSTLINDDPERPNFFRAIPARSAMPNNSTGSNEDGGSLYVGRHSLMKGIDSKMH